ncbi:MAG: hypothetical protein V3T60_01405 [Candidatus Binatia bacterium]
MRTKRGKWITVFLIVAMGVMTLLPDASMGAGATKFMKDLRGETVLLPPSAPERERLILVSFLNVIAEAGIIGAVAIYDNPRTAVQTDYVELYDGNGGLVSVSWLDTFGIRRTAMDSGLLAGEGSELQGLLVLLTEGTHL